MASTLQSTTLSLTHGRKATNVPMSNPDSTTQTKPIATWLRDQETYYAAHHSPLTLNAADVEIPLRSFDIAHGYPLARAWKSSASLQRNIYNIVLDAGLVTKVPSILLRILRHRSTGMPVIVPCLSLTVHGPPGKYGGVACKIYECLAEKMEKKEEEEEDAYFMTDIYDDDNMTDFNLYPTTDAHITALGGPAPPAISGEEGAATRLQADIWDLTRSMCIMAYEGISSVDVHRMMPPLSGKRPKDVKEAKGDPLVTTLVVGFREGTVADFDALSKAYGELLEAQGLEGKMQVRILEERVEG